MGAIFISRIIGLKRANYVIMTYKLCNHYVTIVGTYVHQCKSTSVHWRTWTITFYYSTSVPRVRLTHNLRLAIVMLSTMLDKLRALSAQSALEYGPTHLRASEFQENLRIIGRGVQNSRWEG